MDVHRFYWDKNNIENNYNEMMLSAYHFGRQTFGDYQNEVCEFYLKKANEEDPLDMAYIGIKFKEKIQLG